jgi:hypothetical protein
MEKITDEAFAVRGEDTFGMELDPLDRKAAVPQAHDGSIFFDSSAHFKLIRQTFFGHDE